MNPFSTLGLPAQFSLSKKQITGQKVELSKALHPDRYVGRPAGERRAALGRALEVNDAARRLSNPVSRAEALLEVLGVSVSEEGAPQPPGMFLMEIMELRQSLREAGHASDQQRIESLIEQVRKKQSTTLKELEEAFEQVSSPEQVVEAWQNQVLALVGGLRYFQRFFDEAEAYLDEIS